MHQVRDTFKILPIIAVFLIQPVSAPRSSEDKEEAWEDRFCEKAGETESGIGNVNSQISNQYIDDGFAISRRQDDFYGRLETADLSDFDRDPADQYRYLVKLKIDRLFRPRRKIAFSSRDGNSVMIGVPKPYYRLSGNPYIKGKMDLRIEGSLLGIEGAGLITFGYDLKSDRIIRKISSSIFFDRIAYRLIMRFETP
jgi:hypothetical protein